MLHLASKLYAKACSYMLYMLYTYTCSSMYALAQNFNVCGNVAECLRYFRISVICSSFLGGFFLENLRKRLLLSHKNTFLIIFFLILQTHITESDANITWDGRNHFSFYLHKTRNVYWRF